MDAPDTAKKKPSFFQIVRGLPANFWFANLMEILERLAFFGVRAVVPLYLVASPTEANGLGLSFSEKGIILGVWALFQCLIPMVSGGYTERYGYRKSLAVAFAINICGYLGMAQSKPITDYLVAQGWEGAGFWVFMLAACLIGIGTAIFKPPCHGTIAKTTTEESSSMGWGIFYWVVNIGGALAPMLAAPLRGEFDWQYVFYAAAFVTAANYLPAFLLYKEPEKEPPKEGEQEKGPVGVFVSSIATMVKDARLVVFMLIFSCFWLMFMQLWDLLPNFIDEWVDTSDVAAWFGAVSQGWVLESGQTKPEMIINCNPWSIILLVIPISWLVGKVSKIAAMVIGMVISLVAFVACGMTMTGVFVVLMLLMFSIGEMTCSPTFSAYVALIAPRAKKALYMGYSNVPFAIGWFFGNIFGGFWYEKFSAKFNLARQYLVEQVGMARDAAEALTDHEAMQAVADSLNGGAGGALSEAKQVLWNLYDPYMVWIYLGVFGVVGTLGMIVFYLTTPKTASADQGNEQPA